MERRDALLLGAVAYDPKVVTIWNGFEDYFSFHGLMMDTIFFTNYERQVEAHLTGHIHVAWNSPLAWLQTRQLGMAAMDIESPAILELRERVAQEQVRTGIESQVFQIEPPARHAMIRRTEESQGSSDSNRLTARSSWA